MTELSHENGSLNVSRGIIIVIVKPYLSKGHTARMLHGLKANIPELDHHVGTREKHLHILLDIVIIMLRIMSSHKVRDQKKNPKSGRLVRMHT